MPISNLKFLKNYFSSKMTQSNIRVSNGKIENLLDFEATVKCHLETSSLTLPRYEVRRTFPSGISE